MKDAQSILDFCSDGEKTDCAMPIWVLTIRRSGLELADD
jgi:hypothetical protein